MITSLHSPHVEAVKALLGPRGKKLRRESNTFILEGLQNLVEALTSAPETVEKIYFTSSNLERLPISNSELFQVSDEVMRAMADTVTPQGVLAIVRKKRLDFKYWLSKQSKPFTLAYFWQIQDPGNAGTVIRAADAFGLDAVIFSDNSVDLYSPKVVRSTAGSLWHIPVFEDLSLDEFIAIVKVEGAIIKATESTGEEELSSAVKDLGENSSAWIFGNEARGLPPEFECDRVSISMTGRAESLNLASAASVVMYELTKSSNVRDL